MAMNDIDRILFESNELLREEERKRQELAGLRPSVMPIAPPPLQQPNPYTIPMPQYPLADLEERLVGVTAPDQVDIDAKAHEEMMQRYPWHRSMFFPIQARGPRGEGEYEAAVPGVMVGAVEGAKDFMTIGHDVYSGDLPKYLYWDTSPEAEARRKAGTPTDKDLIQYENPRYVDRALNAATFGISGIVAPAQVLSKGAARTLKRSKLSGDPPVTSLVTDVTPTGPAGLETIERAGDLLKAQVVEDKQVLHDLAERAGMPNVEEISKRIDLDTQTQASIRVNAALRTGRLRHSAGDLVLPVTPGRLLEEVSRLPKPVQIAADDYLKLLDRSDDLRNAIASGKQIRKNTAELQLIIRQLNDYEKRFPEVKDIASQYFGITQAVRDFLAKGENKLIHPKEKLRLDKDKKHYVPYNISNVNDDANMLVRLGQANQDSAGFMSLDNWLLHTPNAARIKDPKIAGNAFETLNDWVAHAARFKLENDTRGAYIKGMLGSQYGGKTIRAAKEGEILSNPKHTISVYENGKRTTYLSSQLQAALLRFDPYTAHYPNLYTFKRGFEHLTTGSASLTFAPKVLIRDSVAGWVFNNGNITNPLKSAVAIPEMAYAKGLQAGADLLEGSLSGIPGIDAKGMAQSLKHKYMQTLYHAANEAGGFEASLMRSQLEANKSLVAQAVKGLEASNSKTGKAAKIAITPVVTIARMFDAGYDILLEAPRYAATKSLVKQGVDIEDAVIQGKKITGDTSRQGKVRTKSGRMIGVDATNPQWTGFLKPTGLATEIIRETTPYFNPMVQGLRKMATSYAENPAETGARTWLAVGLPTFLAFAHNEQLGPEYNDFANTLRSGRDQVMKVYIGIPGKPPEEGLQLDLAHELTPLNSLFTTALYHMARGKEGKELSRAMQYSAMSTLENIGMIGAPTVLNVAGSAVGVHMPESLLNYATGPLGGDVGAYTFSEDQVGFLPENTERTVRALFGGLGDTLLQTAMALSEHGPEAGLEEFGYQIKRKTPIISDVTGTRTAVTNFTPDKSEAVATMRQVYDMMELWDEWFAPDKDYTRSLSSPMTQDHGAMQGREDVTTRRFAPPSTRKPTNPLFEDVGRIIDSKLMKNEIGFKGLGSRLANLTEQIKLLRGYVAGDSNSFREYQAEYMDSTARYEQVVQQRDAELERIESELAPLKGQRGLSAEEVKRREQLYAERDSAKRFYKNSLYAAGEDVKAQKVVEDLKLDLGNRGDVNRLVSYLEKERSYIIDQQLRLIREVEDTIGQHLQDSGLAPAGYKFSLKKDWKPN